jgi:hypothetical protein
MLNIDSLKNLMKVEESETDVYIYLGYIRIASITEDDGRWYASVQGRELLTLNGYATKEQALASIVRHLTD